MNSENKLKRAFIALSLVVLLVVAMPNVVSAVSDGVDILGSLPNGAWETWQDGRMSFGEVVDVHRNPFLPSWEKKFEAQQAAFFGRGIERRDVRAATIVISASDSRNRRDADIYGDGTNDEVQINALAAAGYKIQLLEGTFTTGAPITKAVDNVTLEGQGRGTVIFLAANSDCNVITIGGDGWAIKNLKIDANGPNQGVGDWYGIYGTSKDDVLIEGVAITDADRSGLGIYGTSSYWKIINSLFYENHNYAIHSGARNILISGCSFRDNAQTASAPDILIAGDAYGWIITDCTASVNGYAFVYLNGEDADPHDIAVTDCYIITTGADAEGIRSGYGAYNLTFSGNVINSATGDAGIFIQGGHNITISGNTISGSGTSGILLEGVGSDTVTNVSIIGNTIYNPGQADYQVAILLDGSTTAISDIVIDGNTIYDDRASDYCEVGIRFVSGGVSRVVVSNNSIRIVQGSGINIGAGSGGDDCQLLGNNIYASVYGIEIRDGDDCVISGNRLITLTAINMNFAAVVRCQVNNNNWEGSTNNPSYAAATTPKFQNNINKDGGWWATTTKILFIPATSGTGVAYSGVLSNLGSYGTVRTNDTTETTINVTFRVPDDFSSFLSVKAVWLHTVAGTLDMYWKLESDYAACEQARTTHTDHQAYGATTSAGPNILNCQEPANVLTLASLAKNDLVGLKFERDSTNVLDTIEDRAYILGFLFEYIGEDTSTK